MTEKLYLHNLSATFAGHTRVAWNLNQAEFLQHSLISVLVIVHPTLMYLLLLQNPFDCFRDGAGENSLRIQKCLTEGSFLNLEFTPDPSR